VGDGAGNAANWVPESEYLEDQNFGSSGAMAVGRFRYKDCAVLTAAFSAIQKNFFCRI
jgi:hypothetical protein